MDRLSVSVRIVVAAVAVVVALALPAAASAAYRDVIGATPGLTAFWRLGDASGAIAADSTGLQDGSYAGGPVLGVAGALASDSSTAIDVNAAGQRFVAPHRDEYANAATVELWIRLNSYGDTTKDRAIAAKGSAAGQRNWEIGLGSDANGQLTYGFGSGGTAVGRRSAANLALNRWYLLDYVRTPTKIQLYVNGALDSELATKATPAANTEPVVVGDDRRAPSFADARYDELAFYGRALTAGEIAAHYAAGTRPARICARVAAPDGSDANPGTAARPYRTSTKLAGSLSTGQTGCLRAGTYVADKLRLQATGITLQTYPGDARATLSGAVWLKGDEVTLQELRLDGTTTTQSVSVTINGDRDVLRNNEITNGNTRICVSPTDWQGLRASSFLIERNRIHNCGRLPNTNHDHGIYIGGADRGLVRDNVIYDNADRGLQFFPDAKGNVVEHNTIDGNGEGVLFGGVSNLAADGNVVTDNIISNATVRWLVEASFPGARPSGNTVTGNCLYPTNASADGYYSTNDGVHPIPDGRRSFTVSGSIVGDPLYVDRAGKDFRLQGASRCRGKGAPRDVAAPLPSATSGPALVSLWSHTFSGSLRARPAAPAGGR